MIIKILGAESLGVRGLSCIVELQERKIFIDPGIALGWSRYGFLPHPFQIAIGASIRNNIIEELENSSDIVFSHFDGDHCPLSSPNPYQLGISEVKKRLSVCRIWAKGPNNCQPTQQKRRADIAALSRNITNSEGSKDGSLEFSFPVPHGLSGREEKTVMMTRVEEQGHTFVHASDIQLLDEETTNKIIDWRPDIVLASGPPLYHYSSPSFETLSEKAWKNAVRLSKNVDTLIIDHHVLRSEQGIKWLNRLRDSKVMCAADFSQKEPLFLEAWRKDLNEWLPVPQSWHEEYSRGKEDYEHYRIRGWELLMDNRKIRPCKWYFACPIKIYTEEKKIERCWIENYCLVSNKNCLRYGMQEKGEYHPDNMLPNGEIIEYLY